MRLRHLLPLLKFIPLDFSLTMDQREQLVGPEVLEVPARPRRRGEGLGGLAPAAEVLSV